MIEAIEALKNSGKVIVDEEHDWGYQLRLVNNQQYCCKFLVLTNFTHGSHHRHLEKDETFIVLCGELFVSGQWGKNLFKTGDIIHFPTNTSYSDHEMWAKSLPCVILEISTHDDDNDIEYIKEGN
jgi:mannose-6-phosphate isomerase-like protein (cupin superfamily)